MLPASNAPTCLPRSTTSRNGACLIHCEYQKPRGLPSATLPIQRGAMLGNGAYPDRKALSPHPPRRQSECSGKGAGRANNFAVMRPSPYLRPCSRGIMGACGGSSMRRPVFFWAVFELFRCLGAPKYKNESQRNGAAPTSTLANSELGTLKNQLGIQ